MSDDRWAPDPDYAMYPTHGLRDVPLVVLEAARDYMRLAADYGDVAEELAQPLGDAVVDAVMPLIREWLDAGPPRDR
jgi:hypothetical protein